MSLKITEREEDLMQDTVVIPAVTVKVTRLNPKRGINKQYSQLILDVMIQSTYAILSVNMSARPVVTQA